MCVVLASCSIIVRFIIYTDYNNNNNIIYMQSDLGEINCETRRGVFRETQSI